MISAFGEKTLDGCGRELTFLETLFYISGLYIDIRGLPVDCLKRKKNV